MGENGQTTNLQAMFFPFLASKTNKIQSQDFMKLK